MMGGDFLLIPAELLQERMEVYISVVSYDRKTAGTSMYLAESIKAKNCVPLPAIK